MSWNLNGKPPKSQEKHFLEPTKDGVPVAYEGTIKNISDIYKQKKMNSEAMEDRTTIEVEMNDGKKLPMFCAWKVTKGSGAYSNSKLYDIIELAELLKEAEKVAESESDKQLEFFRTNLIDRECKFLVKTVKKGTPEKYSVVDKMTKISMEESEEVKEEEVKGESPSSDELEESVNQNKKELAEIRETMKRMKEMRKQGTLTPEGYELVMESLVQREKALT